MEDGDDTTTSTPARRTRSGAAKSAAAAKVSTPAPKSSRQKPCPLSKKTRKKVVLMEVEVSDDEEEDCNVEKKDKVNKQESDLLEQKTEKVEAAKTTEDESVKEEKSNDENIEINGSDNNSTLKDTAEKERDNNLVLNDVVMSEVDQEKSKSENMENSESVEKLSGDIESETMDVETKAVVEQRSEIKTSVEHKHEVRDGSKTAVQPEQRKTVENKDKTDNIAKNKNEDTASKELKNKCGNTNVEEKQETAVETSDTTESNGTEEISEEPLAKKIRLEEEADKVGIEEMRLEEKMIRDEVKSEKTDVKPKEIQGEELKLAINVEETEEKKEIEDEKNASKEKVESDKADPDAENISEDELPTVQAVKVPEAEEVSDEELPGPKRAELPADTEVVSEDELPTVKVDTKKENNKRKHNETDYDPGSPTSENESPTKKQSVDTTIEKEKEEKPKPKKLPELDKYWKAVNDDPTDFTGWTYLLQYVDQENDMEAAREAYDAFLSHYPYCYGYWRKYADYEKRKGNKKKCEEVFERGLKAIPLSVDLWIHYLTYVKTTRTEDEDFIRSQFERALLACGLEFRSDRLWDSYIKWETEGKRLQKVTALYDKLLAIPTQGYVAHFDNFQEHITSNAPNKVLDVDEFLALRKEVRQQLKHDVATDSPAADSDAPPGDEDQTKVISSDEETKALRERIISIRRKLHKNTVNAVTARWNYEEGIKRPYFHVKPLERCQLKNWQDYLDYETEQGDRGRIIVLFERCLIACALYEEFWLKFVNYLENLKDPELIPKIRDVYERACTIHHLKKPNLHLQWAMFEEYVDNPNRSAEILVNLEKSVPNVLQIAYRRINLERRRGDTEKCCQLYEHYINTSKNKIIASSIAIKYSRFTYMIIKDLEKAHAILKSAIVKDRNNPRLYLQLIDLTLQKPGVTEKEVTEVIDLFLNKESTDPEQKILFAQRKLEYLEDFGTDIKSVQEAHDQYMKLMKLTKDALKKKETKADATTASSKAKETKTATTISQSSSYSSYGTYGNSSSQPPYPPYSGSQQGPNYYPQYGQGDQYQYQNWQYPQGNYAGYNQWGSYGSGYGY
ncbi:pre-mRNA-processing factor 39 [Diorhabda carinulata]|uniref:pre-mRNA-processing factor 39 n=1 Tax=Diorhabda carinulata TaxID=1163345 RepID=UPI0025A0D06C|nr:pre-mRNA-processing factor 39 [Diorhabda carinulata]